MIERRLEDALRWISGNGNLVDAPFPDNEIAEIYKALVGLIRYRDRRWVLTEDGWRALAS